MSRVPAHLLTDVHDKRTRQLVREVWSRLPAHDRAVLRALITHISDDDNETGDASILGYAASDNVGGDNWLGETPDYRVSFHGVAGVSDATGRWIIAHEFAHVVLRHGSLPPAVHHLYDKESQAAVALYNWHEDEADMQVVKWGFWDDLLIALREIPTRQMPRWAVKLFVALSKAPQFAYGVAND